MIGKTITRDVLKRKSEQTFIITHGKHICLTYDKVSRRTGMC